MTLQSDYNILGLDYGEKRVGVALAHVVARLARPEAILVNDDSLFDTLQSLVGQENVREIVLGLPVPFAAEENDQTRAVRQFGEQLEEKLGLPVSYVNEALTSVESEAAARRTGKKTYIDDRAAAVILERYLEGESDMKGMD